MSAVQSLQNADAKLAGTIDAVTEMVSGIGEKTTTAKQRLTIALHQARARLASQMSGIANLVDVTLGVFDAALADDLLALPVPEPDVVVKRPLCDAGCGAIVAAPGTLCEECEQRFAPVKEADPKTLGVATPEQEPLANEVKDYHEDVVKCHTELGLPMTGPGAAGLVNRVAEALASTCPPCKDASVPLTHPIDESKTFADPPPNGRPRARRKK